MRRFFYAIDSEASDNKSSSDRQPLSHYAIGDTVDLTDSIHHHWCRVLRASVNDTGIIFDGFGGEYQVQLESISKKHASVTLLSYHSEDRTAPLTTKIGLVMSRGERMDYAIQKATELGVTAIQLLSSHHGEVNLKPAQIPKKLAHWQQVAISACEQCGLNRVPLILAPTPIDTFLQSGHATDLSSVVSPVMASVCADKYYQTLNTPADVQLQLSVPAAGSPATPAALTTVLAKKRPYIELLIGSEGGLSVDECDQAAQAGFLYWQIGDRVLRTETAPVVALASLHAIKNMLDA